MSRFHDYDPLTNCCKRCWRGKIDIMKWDYYCIEENGTIDLGSKIRERDAKRKFRPLMETVQQVGRFQSWWNG